MCVCVRARDSVCDPCRACLLSVITSNHLQREAAEREQRVGEAIRGDYSAVLNPKTLPPTLPSLKKDYLFKYCEALEFTHARTHAATQAVMPCGETRPRAALGAARATPDLLLNQEIQ